MNRTSLILVALLAILPVACREAEKERVGVPEPLPEGASVGQSPADWQPGPINPHRLASFYINGEAGNVADVSLTFIMGMPEPLPDLVNGWRVQWGEPLLDSSEAKALAQPLDAPIGRGLLLDVAGTVDGSRAGFDGRIIAVVIPFEQATLHFKMRGNTALVGLQKEAFLDWVCSVQADELSVIPRAPQHPPLPVAALLPLPRQMPNWELPDGWMELPATFPNLARFTAQGEGNSVAIAVLLLDMDRDDELTNVNSWRREVGLPAIAPSDLATLTQTLWLAGMQVTLMELEGFRDSMLVAWINREEGAWVIRMKASRAGITQQWVRFAGFLRTISFPDN